jgi:citrate lyase gamma subunit
VKPKAKSVLRAAKAGHNDKGDQVVHLKPAGDQSGVQLAIRARVQTAIERAIKEE